MGFKDLNCLEYYEMGIKALNYLDLATMELNHNEIANETENISKEGDEILSAELDDEECVRLKKKSRRVSFADITSIHVFDRDEDFETPPDNKPNAGDNIVKTPPSGSSDSQPKDLQHKDIDQHLQVTPISSLQKEEFEVSDAQAATPVSVSDKGSPGEDREFFGPVSLWHIAPGMGVCSPVEDDITLDCTTFSLQFGKLMNPDKQCSNPAEVVKTPVSETEERALGTEDFKTPVEQTGQPLSENTMALTKPKQARWWVVSNDNTLDNCEGMIGMSSSQEKQIKYEYESMSPYLESMLAEKLSEVQPDVSFKELNQGKEYFGSSHSHTDSAFWKTGQGMKLKDSAGVEIKTSTIESEAYMKKGNAILMTDQERDQLAIENMPNKQNKGTELTAAADSFVFDFDKNLQQQQSPRLLRPQWKLEPNFLVDKEVDGCCIDINANECSENTKVTTDVKIIPSIIETVGTEQYNNTETMEGENCSSIKFEAEQQERQTKKLSDSKVGMEPKKYADLEMHGSTTGFMATKHCSGTGYMTTLEGNQSMTVTPKLETGNGTSPLKFETDQSQEKEKEIVTLNLRWGMGLKDTSDAEGETCNIDIRTTENNAIESGQSIAEIAAPNSEEDNHLRLSDDSHIEKSEEQQWQYKKSTPVNMELEVSAFDVRANKQNIDTKLVPDGEFKGHLEAHGSTIDMMATKHCKDTGYMTMLEGNQSMIVTARLKTGNDTSLSSFVTNQSQEKQKQIAAFNSRWDMGLKDPSSVEVETSNIDITTTEKNATESNQFMVEIATTNSKEDNNLRTSGNSHVHKCEEQKWQDTKSALVGLGCYMGNKNVNMDLKMSETEIAAAKHNNVTEVTQDVQMNLCVQSLEAIKCHEDGKMKQACELSLSHFDVMQQNLQGKLLASPRPDTTGKDLAMIEELSATDSIATNHGVLNTDADTNQYFLETLPTKHTPVSVSKFKGMQHQEQQERLLNLKLDVKLNDVGCVQTERSNNYITRFKEGNDIKLTPNLEMNHCDTKTVSMVDNFPCKLEGENSQEKEKSISSNLSQDREVNNPVNKELEVSTIDIKANKQNVDTKLASDGELKGHLEAHGSTIDMMTTKNCNNTGYTTMLEGNQSMIVIARLKTGNGTSLLNFEAEQSQEKQKQIAAMIPKWGMGLKDPSDVEVETSKIDIRTTENNATESSQSMVEIAATNCEENNNLLSLLAKHNNVSETPDVEMNSCALSIEAEKWHEDSEMKPVYKLSLDSFDGKQKKQQSKVLLNLRTDTMQKDFAMIEELSTTDNIVTNHAILNTDAEINQPMLDIGPTKHVPLSNHNFNGMQHEKQKERLSNLKLDVKSDDVDCVEKEKSTSCIMDFMERNNTMLVPNLERNQCDTKIGTSVDNFPCRFEGVLSPEKAKGLFLNLAQDIEVEEPVNVELETSAINVMENKQSIDTKLASGGELKQSLEIMVVKPNKDGRCTLSDCLSGLNFNRKDQMQQLMRKSELEMDPQRSLNMEREISTVPISTAQNNKINVTQKIETDHQMGITEAKDKEDAIFVPDIEKNQSLAQLHNQVKLSPPQCTAYFNREEEHHQQKQEQLSISSKGFKIHGKSKLSEDQLIGNSKEAGSILKPIEMNVTMPRNKQELKSFGFVEDTVLLDRCASFTNEYLEGSVKHFPEPDGAEERKGTAFGKDLFRVSPVSNRDTQQVCQHVGSEQIEVPYSVLSQPKIKHSIPRSDLSHSKCDAVSDSSVTPLKKQTELENTHKYPFISDENLEDSDSKDIQVSLPFSASVSKSLFKPMDSKECHDIPNNTLSTPKESSGNRLEVNLKSSSQIVQPNLSVSGIDQCKSILCKNKLSKNLNSIQINTPLNKRTGLAFHCSLPTQLISTDKKSKTVCELYDLKPNLSAVHKDASLFGNQHHGLCSNSESDLSSSVRPILSPIRGTMCEMTPLGPIADCGSLTNVKKSNYPSVIRNDAKGCSTSNNIFSTPLNLSNYGDANYGYSHLNSIEHLNMCGGSNQIDVKSSFKEHARDTHNANPVSNEHKLVTNFMDTCASNRNLMNNDFCRISHSKGNMQGQRHKESFLQKKPVFLNHENSKNFEYTDGDIILRNAVDSVNQLTSAVKLNTECSSTKSKNGEEVSCMGTENIEMHNNCGNISLPLSEKECSLTQRNKLQWKSFAETQLPSCTSGFISEGPMMLQHARGNGSAKTFEFPCATEKILSLQAHNDKGYLNKKRKCQEMDVQDPGSLIKDHTNSSLSFGIEPVESTLSGKVFLENSEGRMPSTKRLFVTRTKPTEDVIAVESRKLINVSDEICQEVEELHIPLICKPKTQEECLIFIFLSRPQLCLFQETLKFIQEDIDRMKISNNQQFQASDVKKCSQTESKFLKKSLGSLKWLQQVVAYEKSKLLLLQAKKHELMKEAQELHHGCQELDKLKSHYLQMTGRFGGSANTSISRAEKEDYVCFLEAEIKKQVENVSNKRMLTQGSLHKIEGENRKASERVIVMKPELEVLDNKIRDMCKFYCGFLKLKDDTNKEEITKMLKIHIEKQSLATLILKDIQLWIMKDIKCKPGSRFIELAYSDILHQRFVIEGDGPDANVLGSNRLDKKTVEKAFPLLNATEAFGFVLELKQSLKIGGPGSISQVVVETSFLYCTLIYVLEEVQTCRMGLQNLSFIQFVRTLGEELHLQLIFINCTLGLKARVILDMSNLRCAVYPSDILPLQIDVEQFGRQPRELLIVEEVHELTLALKPGYSRIKDLCGCISKFIKSRR
ncbi:uncharacterized protein LOC131063792 isoform X1 [Cryptomeria japonica]|uniref:uncharacterized protein LOC131063792 isoform X1 n=2 Tax=Cryptomeria japonica TaxID=3369 RepID=UPI0027DA546C|nr:uncharacterized protein LOC131063792 isoform X1 [Cryptomeria japonica]XP_057853708.2 uncharacterized protein LOC131063792 isoform X1 [Cryptomeria japonica]